MKQQDKLISELYVNPTKKILVTLSILIATGCTNNNMNDLVTFVAEIEAKHVSQVEALPIITPYETHRYQVANNRDPFKSTASLAKSISKKRSIRNGVHPSNVRNKEELEKYPLDSLVMAGVMNNDGKNWAIIKTPDNNIFRVHEGNYIGENNGKVLNISESKITINEIIADGFGGWAERRKNLALSQ